MVCPPQGGPRCAGEQGGGDTARTPEGLMVEGTEVTLKALGGEERGCGPERRGSTGAELREAGVSGAS